MENGIRIYSGEIDEDDDNPEIRDIRDSMPFAIVGSNTLLEVNGKRVRGRLYPWGVVEVENKDHCDFVKLRNMLIRWVWLHTMCKCGIRYHWCTFNLSASPPPSLIHPPPSLSPSPLTHSPSHSPPLPPPHRTHMQDLKDFTQDVHYENFRKKKLLEGSPAAMGVGGGMEASPSTDAQRIMMEKEKQVRHVTSHMTILYIIVALLLCTHFSSRRCADKWPCCRHSSNKPSTAIRSKIDANSTHYPTDLYSLTIKISTTRQKEGIPVYF